MCPFSLSVWRGVVSVVGNVGWGAFSGADGGRRSSVFNRAEEINDERLDDIWRDLRPVGAPDPRIFLHFRNLRVGINWLRGFACRSRGGIVGLLLGAAFGGLLGAFALLLAAVVRDLRLGLRMA